MPISRRTLLASGLAAPAVLGARPGLAAETVRLGQATTALSFLKIFAARALDSFAPEGVGLSWAAIPGGDPPTLAAVDSGDLDLAAVGSDTAVAAIAKGQPFQIMYSLMSKLPYELTVSNAFLAKAGIGRDAPLAERIGVLKTALVGASAVGGAQDRAVRWLAGRGGLDQKAVKVALVGGPPALGAALENGRIDAFMLSPPESVLAEVGGYGTVLVRPNRELPVIRGIPSLVLVAHADPKPDARARIIKAVRAMNAATAALLADPDRVADQIGQKFFAKVPAPVIRRSVAELTDGLAGEGRIGRAGADLLGLYTTDLGGTVPTTPGWWTDGYVEAAGKG